MRPVAGGSGEAACAPVEGSRRRGDLDAPSESAEPLLKGDRLVRNLHDPVSRAVVQLPLDRRGRLAFNEFVRGSVGVVDKSTRPPGLRQFATSAQNESKRSSGTWESQKPKNTTSCWCSAPSRRRWHARSAPSRCRHESRRSRASQGKHPRQYLVGVVDQLSCPETLPTGKLQHVTDRSTLRAQQKALHHLETGQRGPHTPRRWPGSKRSAHREAGRDLPVRSSPMRSCRVRNHPTTTAAAHDPNAPFNRG